MTGWEKLLAGFYYVYEIRIAERKMRKVYPGPYILKLGNGKYVVSFRDKHQELIWRLKHD